MTLRFCLPLLVVLALGSLVGCTPSIGDKCVLNTDCSLAGDRQCDTSQPNGYCTVFNCTPDSCPDNAACILFNPGVAGCDYNDRNVGRTAHSYCMAACRSNGDCRDGYQCADVRGAPWDAVNQDTNQITTVCVPLVDPAFKAAGDISSPPVDPPVCQADPQIDAALPPLPDAGPVPDAGADVDAGAPPDAGADADAGIADATLD